MNATGRDCEQVGRSCDDEEESGVVSIAVVATVFAGQQVRECH